LYFRNIIFDLDGTLIDSARLTGAIIDQMLVARGIEACADRALIRRMDAVGGEAMIAAVLGPYSSDPETEIAEFRALHREIVLPADLPFAGVTETLARLAAQGIGLAICSNKPQDLCEKILNELGLAHLFAAIVGSTPDRARKPAPEAAQLALAGLGSTHSDTLYCGDSMIDVATAHAAELAVALVEWGYGTAEALKIEPGTPVFNSMSALFETLDGHGRLHFPGR
jgi:phosphoglycolate phosphatase